MIQERQCSGQSIKDFGREKGISSNAYFYWQRKLRKAACTDLAKTEADRNIVPSGWMRLTPNQEQHVKEAMDVEINGCHITVNTQTNLELLKKVCITLRSIR